MSCHCSFIKTLLVLILHLTQEVHYFYYAIIPWNQAIGSKGCEMLCFWAFIKHHSCTEFNNTNFRQQSVTTSIIRICPRYMSISLVIYILLVKMAYFVSNIMNSTNEIQPILLVECIQNRKNLCKTLLKSKTLFCISIPNQFIIP